MSSGTSPSIPNTSRSCASRSGLRDLSVASESHALTVLSKDSPAFASRAMETSPQGAARSAHRSLWDGRFPPSRGTLCSTMPRTRDASLRGSALLRTPDTGRGKPRFDVAARSQETAASKADFSRLHCVCGSARRRRQSLGPSVCMNSRFIAPQHTGRHGQRWAIFGQRRCGRKKSPGIAWAY